MKNGQTMDAILENMAEKEHRQIGGVTIVKENGRFHVKAHNAVVHNASKEFAISFILSCGDEK